MFSVEVLSLHLPLTWFFFTCVFLQSYRIDIARQIFGQSASKSKYRSSIAQSTAKNGCSDAEVVDLLLKIDSHERVCERTFLVMHFPWNTNLLFQIL